MRVTVFSGEDEGSPRARAQRRRDQQRPLSPRSTLLLGNTSSSTITEAEALQLMAKQCAWINTLHTATNDGEQPW